MGAGEELNSRGWSVSHTVAFSTRLDVCSAETQARRDKVHILLQTPVTHCSLSASGLLGGRSHRLVLRSAGVALRIVTAQTPSEHCPGVSCFRAPYSVSGTLFLPCPVQRPENRSTQEPGQWQHWDLSPGNTWLLNHQALLPLVGAGGGRRQARWAEGAGHTGGCRRWVWAAPAGS